MASRVIVFDAFGETWHSVAAFAKKHSGGDQARYERIRSRIYKGMCTAEQAVELERYHGRNRWKRMAEMRSENAAKSIICESTREGPVKPRSFKTYERHHNDLCMRLEVIEKTPFRDDTVYEVTHYCCGLTMLLTHARLLRREQGKHKFCYACSRTGARRKRAACRIALLCDMTEEQRDAFLSIPVEEDDPVKERKAPPEVRTFDTSPPPSILAAQARAFTDVWQDRMYLQWENP